MANEPWRYIPYSAMQAAKNLQAANDWADQQRQQIADQWSVQAKAEAPSLPFAPTPVPPAGDAFPEAAAGGSDSALSPLSPAAPIPSPSTSPDSALPSAARPQTPSQPTTIGQGQQSFIQSLLPAAQQVSQETGIPVQVLLAIPANETGWGSAVAGNNLYGIKGSNPNTGANTGPVGTWEDYGNGRVNIQDTFRAYGDPIESMRDFAAFLRDNSRYGPALQQYQQSGDWTDLIRGIKDAGYATDPDWANKIISIGQGISNATGGGSPATPAQAPAQGDNRTSQFGLGLSYDDALAFCGPAAAMALAQKYGNNIPVAQAQQMAREVGWNNQQGMAGIASEQALLSKMGVSTKLEGQVDWNHVAQDAQNGNPVIISTPGHYFYVTGYDQQTGKFNVGTSGTDLKAGSAQMSPSEMAQFMGQVNGALYVDAPNSPTPSIATTQAPQPSGNSSPLDVIRQAAGNVTNGVGNFFDSLGTGVQNNVAPAVGGFARNAGIGFGLNPDTLPSDLSRVGAGINAANTEANHQYAEMNPLVRNTPGANVPNVSDVVSKGLEAAGVPGHQEFGTSIPTPVGNIDIGPREIAGFGAGLIQPGMGGAGAARGAGAIGRDVAENAAESVAQKALPEAAKAAEEAAPSLAQRAAAAVSRFYHGTGSAFERPTPRRFDSNGLFGPAYYVTDDARVAASYAEKNGSRVPLSLQAAGEGPNVRAIDVPSNLNLLDAEAPAPPELVAKVQQGLDAIGEGGKVYSNYRLGVPTGADVYDALAKAAERFNADPKTFANNALTNLGYDGIRYAGGKRIPLTDSTGQAIQHTALAIFPDSLDKITNALSGRVGGQAQVGFAIRTGAGAALGGGTTYANTDPNDPNRMAKVGAGMAAGAIGANALGAATPTIMRAINEWISPARNTPPAVQDALWQFGSVAGRQSRAARVDAENLAARVKGVLGNLNNDPQVIANFEKTGEFVPNPTPEQAQVASDLRQFFGDTLQKGQAGGYINGDVTNAPGGPQFYFPHAYQDEAVARGAPNGGSFNPRDFYSQQRAYPNIEDAIAGGLTPKSVSDSVMQYSEHAGVSEAKVQLLNDLKAQGPDIARQIVPGQRIPDGFSTVDDNALRGWAFSDPVATALNNIITKSGMRDTALGRGVMDTLGTAKQTLFALSGFHAVTEAFQGVRANGIKGVPALGEAIKNAILPSSYDRFRVANADAFSQAAHAGVTGLSAPTGDLEVFGLNGLKGQLVRSAAGGGAGFASGYEQSKLSGDDDQTALRNGLIAGGAGAVLGPTLGKGISDALWERMVPTLKVLTYKIATDGGADAKAAAQFTNNTFGGQNLDAIARSKGLQDFLRMAVLAPDWWESWARQIGSGVTPGATGDLARAYWLRTGALAVAATEGLNLAFTGHFTDQNDPGHQFEVQLPAGAKDKNGQPANQYLDINGPLARILKGFTPVTGEPADPGRFITNSESLPLGIISEAVKNQDYKGDPIVEEGTPGPQAAAQFGLHALAREAPVGIQSIDQAAAGNVSPALTGFSALSGFRTSTVGPSSRFGTDLRDDRLPTLEMVRNTPEYKNAPPAQQRIMEAQAMDSLKRNLAEKYDLPAQDRGMGPKYRGVNDPKEEARIDRAVQLYREFEANPRTRTTMTLEQYRLGQRFSSPEMLTPAYQRASQNNRGAQADIERQVQNLVGAGR